MNVEKLYNKISEDYHMRDFTWVMQNASIAQIIEHIDQKKSYSCLEFAVGDGTFLQKLKEAHANFQFSGLDISQAMLSQAQKKVVFTPYHCAIDEAAFYIKDKKFDFVVAQSVVAYVGLEQLLAQADQLLTKDGVVALTLTTRENFPKLRVIAETYNQPWSPLKRIMYYFYNRGMQTTLNPDDYKDVVQIIEKAGFKVLKHKHIAQPIHFDSSAALFNLLHDSGYAVNSLNKWYLPSSLYAPLIKFVCQQLSYPIKDKLIAEVVLLQRV